MVDRRGQSSVAVDLYGRPPRPVICSGRPLRSTAAASHLFAVRLDGRPLRIRTTSPRHSSAAPPIVASTRANLVFNVQVNARVIITLIEESPDEISRPFIRASGIVADPGSLQYAKCDDRVAATDLVAFAPRSSKRRRGPDRRHPIATEHAQSLRPGLRRLRALLLDRENRRRRHRKPQRPRLRPRRSSG